MKVIDTKGNYLEVKYNAPNGKKMSTAIVATPSSASVQNISAPAAEELPLEEISNTKINVPKSKGPFNPDSNQYCLFGGNQGTLNAKIEEFVTNEKVHEIIARYYPEFDLEDIELLFYRMNSVGCGYIAAINTIFKEYLFHDEADFYDRFGFPPYKLGMTEEGVVEVYNYEFLFLDFFLYYAKNYRGFDSIEEVYGNVEDEIAFRNNSAKDSALEDENFPRTGMDGTYLETVGEVMQSYLAEKGIELSISGKVKLEPGSEAWEKKRQELEEMGITINPNLELYETEIDAEIFDSLLRYEGKQIIVSAQDFDMYYSEDKDGNGKLDDLRAEDVGSHAMTVVGTTSDGKLVVSTWGEEVVINPEEVNDYIIYDYADSFAPKDIY